MKIKDLNLFFEKGINCKKGNQGDILFIPSGAVFPEKIKEDKCHKTFDTENISKDKLIRKNDVLFNSGGVGTLGRVGFYDEDIWSGDAICDPFVFIIRNNDTRLYSKYLFYYFQTDQVKRNIVKYTVGSTGITSIRKKDILNFSINLPAIEWQKKIVQILDTADSLRQKRKEQLALLDDYLKTVFLDMFGDPMENEKAWKIVKLGDVIIDGPQNGLYKPSSFYGNGVPILRIDCFYDGVVTDITKLKRVVVTDEELRRFQIHEDDIVINRVNSRSHLGKCALIPGISEKTIFESNMMRLTVDKTKALPLFLSKFLTTPFVKKQILSSAKDAVNQSSINQNDVNNFELFLPPINLQCKFVSIVGQVEQTKQKMRDSLDEMDNHFNALMQRYFV